MAENEEGQEKTEAPSAKRLSEAKEKGDIPRSKELNTTVILLVGSIGMLVSGKQIGSGLGDILQRMLRLDRTIIMDPTMMLKMTGDAILDAFLLITPLLLALFLSVFISPMLIGGFAFSTESMTPKLERLDPVKGIKKLISMQGLMELVKSILKVVLVGGLAFVLIWLLFHDILSLGALDFKQAYLASAEMVGWFFLAVCSTVILIAAFDVPFQIFQHRKKLRMTKQEVKEERKNTEGSPEIKGKIRRLQIEAAMRRMMEEVPKADVVITNPTHFAVALRYDDKRMRAPKVVAKGSDLVAARIREIATENNVPLFSAPPLARAIYFTTEINDEIPARLYLAVAQVLAYIFQLKRASKSGDATPTPPSNLDVPDELWKGKH